ncbi:hypothetical protein PIB30_087200 [Stylosanthes scabra]|uniref:Uncharacterized protein n=1 Tax=Stylosanthes scabra TaxID=79078 RepID=A0ABU6RTH7_9FABA|nr:hypothetical protein [Stylosanthes scabra]
MLEGVDGCDIGANCGIGTYCVRSPFDGTSNELGVGVDSEDLWFTDDGAPRPVQKSRVLLQIALDRCQGNCAKVS